MTGGSSSVWLPCPTASSAATARQHKIVIKRADSQSDSNRAAQVAGDLINNDKLDLMMASGTPDTANPVADQCESFGMPSIANFVPWQPFFFGRGPTPDKPFKWTYAHALGLEQIVANFIAMWDQVATNKKVGFLFANDADGVAWTDMKTGLPPAVKAAGYEYFLTRPVPGPERGLHQVHLRLQEERLRDLLRHHHHAGLHQLLETGGAAGLQPESPHHRESAALPADVGSHRSDRLQLHGRGCVEPLLAVQGFHHRQDLPGVGRRLHGQDRRAVDRSHRPVRQVRMGRRRLQAGHEPR